MRGLFRHIGSHLLSLVLVAGSHFRNRQPERVGLDPAGRPVDVRDAFDPALLARLLRELPVRYGKGFSGGWDTGRSAPDLDLDRLAGRLVEEMGVDRHMEEILRAEDQRDMNDDRFRRFLRERGFSEKRAATAVRGQRDIALCTGPHLGGFNRRISVPELVEYAAASAAAVVAGRFRSERRAPFPG
jgi:hypothetical protein